MSSNTKTIAIVGGGFAGVYTARRLRPLLPPDWQVVLFSEENHLVFTPLLGNVVGSSINPMHVVWPVRQMAARVSCLTAAVTGIDLTNRELAYCLANGQVGHLHFDHLVLACGVRVNLDIIPGMAAHAWPVKTLGDALVLRNHLIGMLEKAQVEDDREVRRRLLSVIVVGGGFSGVEVAGEVADLLTASCRFYEKLDPTLVKVTLLQRGERILPELPPTLSEFALRKMTLRGIDIRLKAGAKAVTESGVVLNDGGKVEAATVVCTIGTAINALLTEMKLPLDRGRVKTTPDMRVEGHDNVWAAGDCAAVLNTFDNQPSPPTAQIAVRQAKTLAENIALAVRGEAVKPFFYKPLGLFASIGNNNAVGLMMGLRVSGLMAWFLWRGIYLSKMPTLARKVQIAFDWMWQLFFPRDIVQLNTFETERLARAHYEPEQFIFHKNDPGDRFYIIEKGRVGVYLEENDQPIRVLKAGDYFGEAALLRSTPRTASIKALEPVDVSVLSQYAFKQLTRHLQALRSIMERSAQAAQSSDELLRTAATDPRLSSRRVGEVMNRSVATLPVSLSLGEALRRHREANQDACPIVDEQGRLVGLCTRTDFTQALQNFKPAETPLSAVMHKPVLTVSETAPLQEALLILVREPVKRLVVVAGDDGGRPVGLIALFDLLQGLASSPS